jgi:hypothetical protein
LITFHVWLTAHAPTAMMRNDELNWRGRIGRWLLLLLYNEWNMESCVVAKNVQCFDLWKVAGLASVLEIWICTFW